MNIEQKLEGLRKHLGLTVPVEEARSEIAASSAPRAWASRLGGRLDAIGGTPSFSVTHDFPDGHRHGRHDLASLLDVSPNSFALVCKDPELSYVDLSSAVFLDTETTGLNMGTGTYVFLVGVGYLEGRSFVVRQYFLDGPADESTFLTELHRFLGEFSTLVTFNGKAFDWPLLDSRFRLHRQTAPLSDPQHVDLLHPSRRLWKRRLQSCALSSLEFRLLGVERTKDDVAGWEIPIRYFRYQRSGDARDLEGVFYHNLQDILSLATLTVHMDRVVADPTGEYLDDPIDLFCSGKVYEIAGDGELAVHCYEEALRRGVPDDVYAECLLRLGSLHKRERRWESAVSAWEALLELGCSESLAARVEMAKYLEHVERDFLGAIDHVQHALNLAELTESSYPEANVRDLQHRLSRLLDRSIRAGGWAGAYR